MDVYNSSNITILVNISDVNIVWERYMTLDTNNSVHVIESGVSSLMKSKTSFIFDNNFSIL